MLDGSVQTRLFVFVHRVELAVVGFVKRFWVDEVELGLTELQPCADFFDVFNLIKVISVVLNVIGVLEEWRIEVAICESGFKQGEFLSHKIHFLLNRVQNLFLFGLPVS